MDQEDDEIQNRDCPDCGHRIRSHATDYICWASGCECETSSIVAAYKVGLLDGYGA